MVMLSCALTGVKEGSKNVDESNKSISRLDMIIIFILL
jgi:hypothetical protein